jgi:hypothetical protein
MATAEVFTWTNPGVPGTDAYIMTLGGQVVLGDSLTLVATGRVGASATIQGVTAAEFAQLANINANTISSTQWSYISASNQATATSSTVSFTQASATTIVGGTITLATNTISSSAVNTDITVTPNGTGRVLLNGAPTSANHAATKAYVDSVASGLTVKASCHVATTVDFGSNATVATLVYTATAGASARGQFVGTLVTSNVLTIDGHTLTDAENGTARILVKNQTAAAENGIWTFTISGTAVTLDRATDFDNDVEVVDGVFTFIEQGTTNASTGWVLTTNNPIVVGGASGTALTFAQFSGSGTITGGDGLVMTGNTLDVVGSTTIFAAANSIYVNSSATANQILLSSGTVGVASTFGALPLGNSNSVTGVLSVSNGGTGVATLASGNVLVGAGTSAVTTTKAAPSGDFVGTSDSQTLTNKSFSDSTTSFIDNSDNTKILQFQISGITTGTTRTLTVPDVTSTISTYADNLSVFAATTSAQLAGVINDETGSGSLVFNTSPTLVTPTLGVATVTTVNKVAVTAPATGSTLTIADGKVLTASNTLTFTGTDSSSVAFGAGGTVVYTTTAQTLTNKAFSDSTTSFVDNVDDTKVLQFQLSGITTGTTRTLTIPDTSSTIATYADKLSVFAATTSTELNGVISDNTGSGSLVFNTSPTLVTPTLGAATATSINKVAITAPATGSTLTIADGKVLTISNTLTFAGTDGDTITFPTGGGTIVTTDATQTLTNKTLTDSTTFLQDNADNTKKLQFQLSGIATATTRVLTVPDTTSTIATYADNLSVFAATTSAQLAGVISDETGSGSLVFNTSPTLVTPTLGVATATTVNKVTVTAPATSSTLTIADGKALVVSNTLTFTGTDSSSVAFGAGGTVVYTTATQSLTNKLLGDSTTSFYDNVDDTKQLQFQLSGLTTATVRTLTIPDVSSTIATYANNLSVFATTTSAQLAGVLSDESGSGLVVFNNSPTLITPTLGVATATTINKVAITAPATGSTLTIADGKVLTVSNTLTFAGTDGDTVTFPSGGGTLVTTTGSQTLTNKTFTDSTTFFQDNSDNTKKLQFELSGITTATTRTITIPDASTTLVGTDTTQTLSGKTLTTPTISSIINTGTLTLPTTTTTLVGTNTTDTLTNKTLTDSTTFIQDNGDNTKKVQFEVSGVTTGTTRTLTIPDLSSTIATFANNLSVFAATTSAQLAGVINDETGSGSLVFNTSPTLVTPTLGVATVTTVNKVAVTAPATGSTLTIADGKTLTASNTLTFTGTDSSSIAFGAGGTVVYTTTAQTLTNKAFSDSTTSFVDEADNTKVLQFQLSGITTATTRTLTVPNTSSTISTYADNLSVFAATTSAQLAGVINDETGTGSLVFSNSPTLVTPALGAASGTSISLSSTTPITCANIASSTGTLLLVDGSGVFYKAASSRRWKNDITDLDIDSSKLYDLKPRSFTWNAERGSKRDIGFIAEEVEEILPILVPKDKDGIPESVHYHLMVVPMLDLIQKLKAENNKLNARLEAIEARLI